MIVEQPDFDKNVFVNCPFDSDFEPLLRAILFCLIRFGLKPRIATETSDGGESRIDKIRGLIQESKYSIHDLSRCESNGPRELARLNMPFELGLDFGCRWFGDDLYDSKKILILEEKPYRYQAALSDIAGSDIEHHEGDYSIAIRKVRNWIVTTGDYENLPAGRIIAEYEDFQEWFLESKQADGFTVDDFLDLPIPELMSAMVDWVDEGAPRN